MTREEISKVNYDKTHKIIDNILYKKCSRHHKNFPNIEEDWFPCSKEYFYKFSYNKTDGFSAACKECDIKETGARQYKKYHENEDLKRYHREYFLDNQDYYRDVTRKYRDKNKEILKEKQKIWWNTNKEQTKQYREYHKNHEISKTEWNNCLDYFNHECAYCGLSEKDHFTTYKGKVKHGNLHREHVNPNGKNDLSNCIPSCGVCNSSKNSRILSEWYNENISVFDEFKLLKIKKWLKHDYKHYIEQKVNLPYIIKMVRNKGRRDNHFELWSKKENGEMLELLEIGDKKKDLDLYIDKYYNLDKTVAI